MHAKFVSGCDESSRETFSSRITSYMLGTQSIYVPDLKKSETIKFVLMLRHTSLR
jgi:hypothetical protein